MAHEITSVDNFGEIENAEEGRAWHGLSKFFKRGMTAREGFEYLGLGWLTELLVPSVTLADGTVVEDQDFRMHVRMDTKESLGVVGKDYKVISNQYMAEFADSLVGADATVQLQTAGSLRRGKRVFCSIKLPKTIEVVKDDVLNLYIIVSNAHDGSAGFNVYGSSTRPVCANTLRISERELYRGVSFPHTGDIDVKIEKARQALGIIVRQSEVFEQEVKAMAKKRFTKEQIAGYFDAIYTRMFGEITDDLDDKEKERRQNHMDKTIGGWLALMEDAKQNIKGIEQTAWAAYNAFSQWSDHERGRFGAVVESEARVHSNLFGVSANDKRNAYRQALQLATA